MLLKNKNIFITGTNTGIGKAILTECAKNGANIWAHARSETDEFKCMINELSKKYNVQIWPVYFDLKDEESINAAFKKIRRFSN